MNSSMKKELPTPMIIKIITMIIKILTRTHPPPLLPSILLVFGLLRGNNPSRVVEKAGEDDLEHG